MVALRSKRRARSCSVLRGGPDGRLSGLPAPAAQSRSSHCPRRRHPIRTDVDQGGWPTASGPFAIGEGAMNRGASVEELAERTGEPVARLREWRSLGLIGSEDGEWFRPDDVERVR